MPTWNTNNNCMSWAIQDPTDWYNLEGYLALSHEKVAEMFGKQHNCKLVQKQDMKFGKEYIALRITIHDFHFMRRNATGHWTHKQGRYAVKTISQKNVFAREWVRDFGINYGGPIWLFEVR
jgi:hypothetical protein